MVNGLKEWRFCTRIDLIFVAGNGFTLGLLFLFLLRKMVVVGGLLRFGRIQAENRSRLWKYNLFKKKQENIYPNSNSIPTTYHICTLYIVPIYLTVSIIFKFIFIYFKLF